MFESFPDLFTLAPGTGVTTPWREPGLTTVAGYVEFSERYAGCSFEGGLYRVHDASTGPLGLRVLHDAFPGSRERATPFAYDWLGRQFAVDTARLEGAEPLILLLEPGTGQALEIPLTFARFHEQLDGLREPALANGFFLEWAEANPAAVPLAPTQCVGYGVPLFLGGEDVVSNLEIIDFDVYWTLCGQLLQGTAR